MLCPMPGKCRWDDKEHPCEQPVCIHLRQQRGAIAKQIAALVKKEEKTKEEIGELCALKRQYAETLRSSQDEYEKLD